VGPHTMHLQSIGSDVDWNLASSQPLQESLPLPASKRDYQHKPGFISQASWCELKKPIHSPITNPPSRTWPAIESSLDQKLASHIEMLNRTIQLTYRFHCHFTGVQTKIVKKLRRIQTAAHTLALSLML
jgi:hypothetical protein